MSIHRGYVANIEETLSQMENYGKEIILVTDGGYDGQDNIALAKEKNVKLAMKALIGKEAPDAPADLEFIEERTKLLKCADCPNQEQCHPKIHKKAAAFSTSKNASNRAKSQRYMQDEEFSNLAKLRNGVETIPSNIRKNYHLDKLPRGKQRGKFFFGSKIAALNFRKLLG